VENVRLWQLEAVSKSVLSMEQTLSNSNANSAAQSHSGSVGVTLISVNRATRNNVVVIMSLVNHVTSFPSALVQLNAH
jgi:hypothetical protein